MLCETEACVNSRPLGSGETPRIVPTRSLQTFSWRDTGPNPRRGSPRIRPQWLCACCDRALICELRLSKFWDMWTAEYLRNLPPTGRGSKQGELMVGI